MTIAPWPRPSTAALLAALVLLLAPAATAAAAPVRTVQTKHYQFTHDLDRATAREVAKHMDRVFDEYSRRMSAFPVRQSKQINLYVWADRETYIAFLREKGVEGAQFTGGLFFVRGGEAGLTTWVNGQSKAAMYHTLQHEGFHQFAHLRVGSLPPWANEGLAEYFGHGVMVRGKLLTGVAPSTRVDAMRRAVERAAHFPFDDLINMSSERWNGILQSGDPRAQVMYTQAWAVAHFLVESDNGKFARPFQSYLELIADGRSHTQAFQQAFGSTNMAPFEAKWIDYLETWEPDELSTAQQRLDFLGEGLKALHERDIAVASVEDLKRELQARGFEVVRRGHGGAEVLSAQDDDLFRAPGQPAAGDDQTPARPSRAARARRRSAPPAIEFTPATGSTPPTLEITGLRAPAKLVWTTGPDGALVHEIRFQ